ncbi:MULTISPECIES: hypothetical protein [unclassified Mesorhizobium]|uniref:hypothetical protein n=1 Tax=unclassified Mesorhizobium TaxID=325217 RepID=UPI0015CB2C48|nr:MULTISPECIES: hypothetical protein [unclassified Mesorhizobium]
MGLIFFEKRGGVQNRDVIEGFAAMIEAWGMPQSLYFDNGKEFGFDACATYTWSPSISCTSTGTICATCRWKTAAKSSRR